MHLVVEADSDRVKSEAAEHRQTLTVYSILSRNSSISGIAKSLNRPPDARTASNTIALDCKEFKWFTASWYDLVDIFVENFLVLAL